VCAGDAGAPAVHFKDREETRVRDLRQHIERQQLAVGGNALGALAGGVGGLVCIVHFAVTAVQTVFVVAAAALEHDVTFWLQLLQ